MHRTATIAAVAAVSTAVGGAPAAPSAGRPEVSGLAAAERVQYQSDWRGPRDVEDHRWLHLQQLRVYEEERMAEAARRKALRGEKERAAARRTWWDAAQREQGHWRHSGF